MEVGVFLQKTVTAWGTPPAWVTSLAIACDSAGLRKTAEKLRVSPASVSVALHNRRGYKTAFIQAKVESVLMIDLVPCPLKGLMSKSECEEEQQKPFAATNKARVQQYAACKNCRFRKGK